MATVRRSRAKRFNIGAAPRDPIADVLAEETERVADELSDVLEELAGIPGSDVTIAVYKTAKTGPWGHCRNLDPPVKIEALLEDLKEEFGPGDYAIRVLEGGKIRKTQHFGIASPKAAVTRPGLLGGVNEGELLLRLLDRDKGGGDNAQLIALMMNQSDKTTQMMMSMMTNMVTMVTANKPASEDSADRLLKTIALVREMQGPQSTMKDAIETITAIKAAFGGEEGGSGGLMGMAEKAMPALAQIVSQLQTNGGQGPPQGFDGAPAALPAPRNVPPVVAGAGGAPLAANDPPAGDYERHPVIELVKRDILYFMERAHDPGLTATAIGDVLETNGVTEDQIHALGMEILAAGDQWPEALLRYGLDVRANAEWFFAVVTALGQEFSDGPEGDEPDRDDADAGGLGQGRGPANPADNARPGGARKPADNRAKPGGEADSKPAPKRLPG